MSNLHSTKTLRLNAQNVDGLFEYLEKYPNSFDRIVFFSHHTHSVKSLDFHRETVQNLIPVIKRLKAMNIKAGFNILGTVGFFPENNDPTLSDMPRYRMINGNFNEGKLCPSNPQTLKYVKELYKIYASAHPDIIYIDDDIDDLNCVCDECLCAFNEKHGIKRDGKLTFSDLCDLFNSDDRTVRKHVRECWVSHSVSTRANLCELIENTSHAIDSHISLGFMTYTSGIGSFGCEHWSKKLSGGGNYEISWRPGGGVYKDDSLYAVCDKANRISVQIRYIPRYVTKIESEIENFPYQLLEKSPEFTAFESFIYQAAGCTGTAFNVMSREGCIGQEHEIFFKIAEQASEYSKLLTETFGRSPLLGVGFQWNELTPTAPGTKNWSFPKSIPIANDIHRIGIPFACEDECLSVRFLNGEITDQLPIEELRRCLSNGVYMDCEALEVCNKRGFESLTGFVLKDCYDSDTMEIELEHPLNMPGEQRRNPRQAFGYTKQTFTIEKSTDSAEYLAMHTDLDRNLRGASAGIFENELGGRVYVSGITPFEWCYSLSRTLHIKNVLRWLSKDSLPAYIASFHRVRLWVRDKALFVANVSMEDAQNIEMMIKTESDVMEVFVTKGASIINNVKITARSSENGYRLFVLPEIPITGTALIRRMS